MLLKIELIKRNRVIGSENIKEGYRLWEFVVIGSKLVLVIRF